MTMYIAVTLPSTRSTQPACANVQMYKQMDPTYGAATLPPVHTPQLACATSLCLCAGV